MSAKSGSDLHASGTGILLWAGLPSMQRWACVLARETHRPILQACPLAPIMTITGQVKPAALTATWSAGSVGSPKFVKESV